MKGKDKGKKEKCGFLLCLRALADCQALSQALFRLLMDSAANFGLATGAGKKKTRSTELPKTSS